MNKPVKVSLKLNAFLNIIRQICSVIFPLITFPYVTRVLHVENYGKINWCYSIVGYFTLVASLGFGTYAIREGTAYRDDKQKFDQFAGQIFTLNLCSTLLAYVLLGILLLFMQRSIEYKVIIGISSVGLILTTLGVEWIYGIFEDYLYITIRSILVQLLSVILLFLFVKTEDDYIIYVVLVCLSSGLGNIFNFFHAKKYTDIRLTRKTRIKDHIRPVLILFFNSALVTIYLNSDTTILGLFCSDEIVGMYGVSVRVYTIIKGILTAIVGVTIPRLSYYVRTGLKKEFSNLANNVYIVIVTICIPMLIGLFLVSQNAIMILAGEEYLGGTLALRILSFALIMATLANLFTSGVLIACKKEKIVLVASMLSAFLNIGLNFIFIPKWSLNGAAITTLLAETLVFIISFVTSKRYVSIEKNRNTWISVGVGCVAIVGICLGVDLLNAGLWVDTILKVVLSGIAYAGIQILLKNKALAVLFKNRQKSTN